MDAVSTVPAPVNEPVRSYGPGSADRAMLEGRLKELAATSIDLPMTIGGERRMGGGAPIPVVQPHNHASVLGTTNDATPADVQAAISGALGAPTRGVP